MNSKKSKNKNRAKSANILPTQNVSSSEISDKFKTNVVEQIKCEEKQCEQTSADYIPYENVPILEIAIDPEITPVKPKRNKGKKKKKDELVDGQNVPGSTNDPSFKTADTLDVIDKPQVLNSDIENEMKNTTAGRKNKIKSNNQIEKSDTEEIKGAELIKEIDIETSVPSNTVTSQSNLPKKKHKKKKHPQESLKAEEATCTSAFQHILDHGESQDEIETDKPNIETIVPDVMIEECQESLEPIQPAKKKKNKKHRKHSPAIISYNEEQSEAHEEIIKTSKEIEEQNVMPKFTSEPSRESSPKPKAKIVKPVDKKRKNKNVLASSYIDDNKSIIENVSNESFSTFPEIIKDDIPLTQKNDEHFEVHANLSQTIQPNKNIAINIETWNLEKEKNAVILETTDIIGDDMNNQQIASDTIQECETACEEVTEPDNSLFTEVRPSRKKKRSAKSSSEPNNASKISTELINTTNVVSEDHLKIELLKDANITPDFIHYPRSSSQQQIDNNNNTIIQEIHSPDEVRLGIPILMSIPVIQGSGESPEVRSQMDPLEVEVIELKINEAKDNNNSTIIQSETIDDTIVMEELKLSIEKSLAELTAIEMDEMKVDEQFLDVFQNNPVDIPVENITEEIISIDNSSKKLDEITAVADNLMTGNDIQLEKNVSESPCSPPVCPARKDKKGKQKKRGKKGTSDLAVNTSTTTSSSSSVADTQKSSQESSAKEKDTKSESTQNKGKQQLACNEEAELSQGTNTTFEVYFEPIDNFEDALTSSNDDINKTFEIIAKEVTENTETTGSPLPKPVINITEPEEDRREKRTKENPASQPKNLLGHPSIPVSSDKADYKKEKHKAPSSMQAKVKIKDAVDIGMSKRSKESQTLRMNKSKQNTIVSNTYKTNENDDFVYKYSFRKVYLPNICHVCDKELCQRVPCKFCNLVFYCSQKHKDGDWSKHQSLCFAVCTIAHLKEQKFIYGYAQNITGQEYRLLRMQTIMTCEKTLKRKLVPWEQEALLYPRMCADAGCREWRQGHLTDCAGCGQVAYCSDHPEHLPISHQRWCKSYALYQKLVNFQQTKGRLEPRLPNKVMTENYEIREKINEVLASLYDEKIDMGDTQYATLTQVASAPLTAAFSYQLSRKTANGLTKVCCDNFKSSTRTTFTIHIVGAELQFEADALNKWEKFFLHLRPDVKDLRIVLISSNLNPSNLPLDLLRNVKLCEHCRSSNRRLLFSFEDKKTYLEYYTSEDFLFPEIVCAFNPSIERSSIYNSKDSWPSTLKCIAKLKIPFVITAYTLNELARDMSRIKQCSPFDTISEAKYNCFASVRPDRNFITDDEIPLLFKNYCFSVVCG